MRRRRRDNAESMVQRKAGRRRKRRQVSKRGRSRCGQRITASRARGRRAGERKPHRLAAAAGGVDVGDGEAAAVQVIVPAALIVKA